MLRFLTPDQGSGFCVTGKIEAGYIQTGDRILAMPPNETCTVKGMHRCGWQGISCMKESCKKMFDDDIIDLPRWLCKTTPTSKFMNES